MTRGCAETVEICGLLTIVWHYVSELCDCAELSEPARHIYREARVQPVMTLVLISELETLTAS